MSLLTPLTGRVTHRRFVALDFEVKDGASQRAGFTRPTHAGVYFGWGKKELEKWSPERLAKFHRRFEDKRFFAFLTKPSTVAEGWGEDAYWHYDGCVDRVMRFLLTPEFSRSYIYAHNGGRFDFEFILPWLEENGKQVDSTEHYRVNGGRGLGFRWSITPVQSSIQLLKISRGKQNWSFVDSLKLIPLGLDAAGETFGVGRKLEHDLDLDEFDPQWFEYLRQDCVVLYRVVEKFHRLVEDELGGEVGITAAATSMNTFRRSFLPRILPKRSEGARNPLAGLPRSEETHEFVRDSYVGGRTERFVTRMSGLRYYDRNSSYPASMLSLMPAGDHEWHEGTPNESLTNQKIGFVECDVEVPDMNIPPLPIRGTEDCCPGKLIFPVGRLHGIWEWSELEMAMKYGARIERCYRSVWYRPVPLFDEFVAELYSYRQKTLADGRMNPRYSDGLAYIAKLLGNSGYGKFAMRQEREKMYVWDDPRLDMSKARPASGKPDSLIWYQTENADACYIMPQISARVTSIARQALYEEMRLAEKLGGVVCYTDTDSVITTAELPTGGALGEWKDEYPELSGKLEGEFLAPKLYLLWNDQAEFRRTKAKGVDASGCLVIITDEGRGKPIRMATQADTERGVWVPRARHAPQMMVEDPALGRCLCRSVRKKAEREVVLYDLYKVLAQGGTIEMLRLEKLGALARAGFQRGPRIVTVPRTLRGGSDKREVLENGRSRPYRLSMW